LNTNRDDQEKKYVALFSNDELTFGTDNVCNSGSIFGFSASVMLAAVAYFM
jgi:hypothetical protein